jgi:hypothetical protein
VLSLGTQELSRTVFNHLPLSFLVEREGKCTFVNICGAVRQIWGVRLRGHGEIGKSMAQSQHGFYLGEGICRRGLQQKLESTVIYKLGELWEVSGRSTRKVTGRENPQSTLSPSQDNGLRAGICHPSRLVGEFLANG